MSIKWTTYVPEFGNCSDTNIECSIETRDADCLYRTYGTKHCYSKYKGYHIDGYDVNDLAQYLEGKKCIMTTRFDNHIFLRLFLDEIY